jgi:hypothetical protein
MSCRNGATLSSATRRTLNDRGMPDNCFGIICGDFFGKRLLLCPSEALFARDMKEYELSTQYSSLNKAWR